LERSLEIGEYRDRAYRVRRDLLQTWGDLTCRDGFIQRSAVPPAFRDPDRFLRWFEAQSPILWAANNPSVPSMGSPRPRSAALRAKRATLTSTGSPPVILVHLRQPNRSNPREARTDPLYEYGSFGTTGCHSANLLRDGRVDGARLGFVQPGPNAMRLVHLTPPVRVIDHGRRREARWSPARKPLRYDEGVLLIDNDGRTDVRRLRLMLDDVRRDTWVAQFSSRFRSRARPLPPMVADEVVAAWERRVTDGGPRARARHYWDALPFPPPSPDRNREATRARLLAEARDSGPRRKRRC